MIGLPSPSTGSAIEIVDESNPVTPDANLGTPTPPALWQSLETEFLQLDVDLARANELLDRYPQDDLVRQAARDLRQRTDQLRTRRRQFGAYIKKEME